MNKPNSITTLVEHALENCPEATRDSSLVECVGRSSLDGIKGIGQILQDAGIGCGKIDCTPYIEQLPDGEALFFIGNLIEDLAGVAKLCSDHRARRS